ncbi:uncharacterized protein NFIA_026270 [Aspergillus fischeri NRRL 181]|uniref:F-box domain-containing protein n=1 Tax=Neosartorya fischeri (strain ATCC 1020 / DSM 3700 / CBS 544.65 / FGSC A1164 / JCM 1740 / NRRL 181 / WB 181) TaxID=331117 RepID=A1DCJ3_NEOFI|nr:conserved hypothetical protein [Aspergillus fischeri NRRL 181]EAW19553.1 conserved hypothetical protein [Aspergillus fischeri NRRL 181]KAG2021821.1 hypothetical protein GB937_004369 [Aspergillus fischeri]
MPSSAEQTFSIYELAEHIILQLNNPVEIVCAQRVCRNWRDVIRTSPALQEACWYQSNTGDAQTRSISSEQTWKLNPAFNRIGVSISRDAAKGGDQDQGDFSLEEDIYDKPGSWTTMLATQPPCQRMLFECHSYYSDDQILFYLIASMAGPLLMGDIMAVLAECRNRQEYGLDRWGGLRHYTGELVRWEEEEWEPYHWVALDKMPDNVSINVAIEMPWGYGGCPAFSLRRVYGTEHFLHEMILHKMIMDQGHEYQWDETSSAPQYRPVNKSKYKANLLAVKEHQGKYLSICSNVFRLLSEVK